MYSPQQQVDEDAVLLAPAKPKIRDVVHSEHKELLARAKLMKDQGVQEEDAGLRFLQGAFLFVRVYICLHLQKQAIHTHACMCIFKEECNDVHVDVPLCV